MTSCAFIGIGSNRGKRLGFISDAINSINDNPRCRLLKTASVYETKAFGKANQNNFLNTVIKIETSYILNDLFVFLKDLEKSLGRQKSEQWGPREIDLDILLFDNMVYSDEVLTVPHKGILERDFVFQPLLEIEPDITHPGLNKKIRTIDLSETEQNIISIHPNRILSEREDL